MFKNGQLPGATMRQLEKARYGGKSIGELTDFCKKLANGEELTDLSSVSSGDSDHDGEGNSKAFNHPFVLKDRGPIVMNIRNSVPLPTRSADQTNAILQAFPVSSGQQHRQSEMEWVPVEPNKQKPSTDTTVAVIKPTKRDVPGSTETPKEGVVAKVTPTVPPAPSTAVVPPTAQPAGPQMNHPPAFITYPPLRNYATTPVQPLQPPPQPSGVLSESVFPAAAVSVSKSY